LVSLTLNLSKMFEKSCRQNRVYLVDFIFVIPLYSLKDTFREFLILSDDSAEFLVGFDFFLSHPFKNKDPVVQLMLQLFIGPVILLFDSIQILLDPAASNRSSVFEIQV